MKTKSLMMILCLASLNTYADSLRTPAKSDGAVNAYTSGLCAINNGVIIELESNRLWSCKKNGQEQELFRIVLQDSEGNLPGRYELFKITGLKKLARIQSIVLNESHIKELCGSVGGVDLQTATYHDPMFDPDNPEGRPVYYCHLPNKKGSIEHAEMLGTRQTQYSISFVPKHLFSEYTTFVRRLRSVNLR